MRDEKVLISYHCKQKPFMASKKLLLDFKNTTRYTESSIINCETFL